MIHYTQLITVFYKSYLNPKIPYRGLLRSTQEQGDKTFPTYLWLGISARRVYVPALQLKDRDLREPWEKCNNSVLRTLPSRAHES